MDIWSVQKGWGFVNQIIMVCAKADISEGWYRQTANIYDENDGQIDTASCRYASWRLKSRY